MSDDSIIRAHGSLMTAAFAVMFPLGAVGVRTLSTRSLVWLHAAWQITAYSIAIAAMGMGAWVTSKGGLMSMSHHQIIGIVVILILFALPALGYLHHMGFRRTGTKTVWGLTHRMLGRLVIVLGALNGGLGLYTAEKQPYALLVSYSLLVALTYTTWLLSGPIKEFLVSRKKGQTAEASVANK